MAVQPTQLCIISRHPLPGWHFVTALQASLGQGDYLDVIMDRRHGGSSGNFNLTENRRRRPEVDLALETNGFAIISASGSLFDDPPEVLDDGPEVRLESSESDEPEEPRQSSTLTPKLLGVLIGVTLAALVWSLAGHVTGPPSGGSARPSGQTNESSAVARSSAVTEEPIVAETRSAPTEAAPARPNIESAANGPSTARQNSNAVTPKPTPEPAVGPRAELVGEPVPRGRGKSYAVRLLDHAGRPMVVTSALLVARMADGTVEKIPMGALPEPGTYRGTVPTGRSTLVDLRIRMTTGDKSLEVAVRPKTPA